MIISFSECGCSRNPGRTGHEETLDVFLPLSPVWKWPGDPVTPSKRHFALVPHVDAVQMSVFFVCFITSLNLPPISGKYWKWLKDPLWLSSHKSNGPTIRHQSVSLNLSSSAFKRAPKPRVCFLVGSLGKSSNVCTHSVFINQRWPTFTSFLKPQASMRKESSFSECMLFSVRRSGSLSSSLVNLEASLGAFLLTRDRRARIKLSWSISTEFTFSMPERSVQKKQTTRDVLISGSNTFAQKKDSLEGLEWRDLI